MALSRTLLAIALLGPATANAAPVFDRPTNVQNLAPASDDDPEGALRCTYYNDLMVREIGTDTSSPGPATIQPLFGSERPSCRNAHGPDEVIIDTADFTLLGREGQFLLFSATDPNGAIPFKVINAETGRVIYTDATAATKGFRSVVVVDGTLRLRFRRGVNAPCSIVMDGVVCWTKLASQGLISYGVAELPPPTDACNAAYAKVLAPAADPSVILYDVSMWVDGTGRMQVTARGQLACEPMP